jgi:hypothetical protein
MGSSDTPFAAAWKRAAAFFESILALRCVYADATGLRPESKPDYCMNHP